MTSLQFILMLEAFENFKGKAEAAEFHDDRIEGARGPYLSRKTNPAAEENGSIGRVESWMRSKRSYLLVLLACFALAWPGISLASPAPEQQTVTMSRTDLTELQENNRKQQTALMQSAEALKKAQDALRTSTQALKQTREELNQSKVETQNLKQALTASQSETAMLLSDLEKQKQ